MTPRLRNFLFVAASAALATYTGWLIAEGSYLLPLLLTVAALSASLMWLLGLSADVIIFGVVLCGYIVGNRGFAQLMPAPRVPLLPAEIVLLICGGWLVIQSGFARRLPVRRDWLNWMILLWMAVGTARLLFDLPQYGFNAARDYAMVYYAGFFLIAQHYGAEPRARAFLLRCLIVAALLLPPVYFLFTTVPQFFLTILTVRGVPLVYFKGDLVATFMACGALILFHETTGKSRYWSWPLATGVFLLALANNNRATMLGAVVALVWLAAARRWLFPLVQLTTGTLALCGLITLAVVTDNEWAQEKSAGLRDRVVSLTDLQGAQRYQSEESANKGDNNRFRTVWWRSVIGETWERNPLLGLGFGYDLAQGFLQEYSPEIAEEFTTRAPHSILVSAFGRMGLVGLGVWGAVCTAIAVQTWRGLRRRDDLAGAGLWSSIWVILFSACFGVVLEGPMGAVVFWTILGLAHSQNAEDPEATPPLQADRETASA